MDEGVYTRNRAFRLYLSSKNGKRKRLTPTLRWLETHELFERDARSDPRELVFFPDERVFVASLVAARGMTLNLPPSPLVARHSAAVSARC